MFENSKVPVWLSRIAPIDIIIQWILYGYFHLKGLIKGLNGTDAYYQNPFELEAYANDEKENYLLERKPYAWVDYWRKL